MDSLLVSKLNQIRAVQDSLLITTHNLQVATHDATSLRLWQMFLPFIGVIVGGAITYWGQSHLKGRDTADLREKERREARNTVIAYLNRLYYYLGELAYLEIDSKLQYQLSISLTGEYRKRALEEHYNDYEYISSNRTKVTEAMAAVQTGFMTCYELRNTAIPDDVSGKLKDLNEHLLNLRTPDDYDRKRDLTTEELKRDVANLRSEYTRNLPEVLKLAMEL